MRRSLMIDEEERSITQCRHLIAYSHCNIPVASFSLTPDQSADANRVVS